MTSEENIKEEQCRNEERLIAALPDGMEKYHRYIDLAEVYMENDMDNGALRVYQYLAPKLQSPSTDEEAELFERTMSGIFALSRTDNDYVSEKCSNLIARFL